MNYREYQQLFDDILHSAAPQAPYDDAAYLHYTKMNQARMKRRERQLIQTGPLADVVTMISRPQHWIIITEPWCGDAAHTLPQMIGLADLNPKISYGIQLRDTEPYLINSYLTGTSKSIPKLIVRDDAGHDLFTWGPRPQPAQLLANELKAADTDHDVISAALQQWYNQDDGKTFAEEMQRLLTTTL